MERHHPEFTHPQYLHVELPNLLHECHPILQRNRPGIIYYIKTSTKIILQGVDCEQNQHRPKNNSYRYSSLTYYSQPVLFQ